MTTTTTTTAAETVLTRLRRETRPAHERAERVVGMPQSSDDLARVLARFYGFLEPWEQAVALALAPLAGNLEGRAKTPLLEQDLAYLGVPTSDLPRCQALPDVRTLPRALGSMYVFEGATLGGVIVARHVEHTLGLRDGLGYAFHRSYGPRVGEMWRAFGQVLLAAGAGSKSAEDDIVAAARETFDRLCDWFAPLERVMSHPDARV